MIEKIKCKVALKAFFKIMQLWSVNDKSAKIILGYVPHSTFYHWKRTYQGHLTHDQMCRISLILGIYKSLQILFLDPGAADGWIKKENSADLFHGCSALELMLGGNYEDLYVVRQYLNIN